MRCLVKTCTKFVQTCSRSDTCLRSNLIKVQFSMCCVHQACYLEQTHRRVAADCAVHAVHEAVQCAANCHPEGWPAREVARDRQFTTMCENQQKIRPAKDVLTCACSRQLGQSFLPVAGLSTFVLGPNLQALARRRRLVCDAVQLAAHERADPAADGPSDDAG